jgi:hypothetical protein
LSEAATNFPPPTLGFIYVLHNKAPDGLSRRLPASVTGMLEALTLNGTILLLNEYVIVYDLSTAQNNV